MSNTNNENKLENKNQLEIKICNFNYNLTTTESPEYIKGIAKYINNKIDEISISHKNLNKNSIPFFLTLSLNIADDLFKQRKQFAKSTKSIESLKNDISKINKESLELDSLKNELSQKNSEISLLKNEQQNNKNIINSLENNIKTMQKEIDCLKESLEKLTISEEESINLLCEKDEEICRLKSQIDKLK